MFRVQGVSPPPLLIYRFLVAVLLIILLYTYHSHHVKLDTVVRIARDELDSCHANSESIFSKLKVIVAHKRKMEEQATKTKTEFDRKMAEMRRTLTNCQSDLDVTKQKLEKALETTTTVSTTTNGGWMERQQILEEVAKLRSEMENLKNKAEDDKRTKEKLSSDLDHAKKDLEACRVTVRQHVGALPQKNYSQNETAFFQRKHRADEALSFDRGAIEEHRGEVVPGGVLMQRIEAKNELKKKEDDLHPDDRAKDDDYVNEQPDGEEKDYKEHHDDN